MNDNSVIAQIPTSFYVIAGSLILANIGSVITVLYGIGRVIWFLSKLESRVDSVEKITSDNGPIYKDLNAAHSAIREIRTTYQQKEI